MNKSQKAGAKKALQLGMPFGTAGNRLRKSIVFSLLCRLGENVCFRCLAQISCVEDLSIEHKEPWIDTDDPSGKFFDLGNIAFSHLSCNVGAGRRPTKKYFTPEDRRAANASIVAKWKRDNYSSEERRARYLREGR